ncbi:hypothetical protein THIARS_70935 [Thiomonas delicata]|uniref:Uncharacterized protein n=1 Tax=Thiomonas delicata TaxID=364030 RepID=A0A238D7U0_THIDL|nr:hypothetical protein THIARS_70935 [Thiomonas delicata]
MPARAGSRVWLGVPADCASLPSGPFLAILPSCLALRERPEVRSSVVGPAREPACPLVCSSMQHCVAADCPKALAWVRCFFSEHNHLAAFKRPIYALRDDWMM